MAGRHVRSRRQGKAGATHRGALVVIGPWGSAGAPCLVMIGGGICQRWDSAKILFEQFQILGDHGIAILGRDRNALLADLSASLDPSQLL